MGDYAPAIANDEDELRPRPKTDYPPALMAMGGAAPNSDVREMLTPVPRDISPASGSPDMPAPTPSPVTYKGQTFPLDTRLDRDLAVVGPRPDRHAPEYQAPCMAGAKA